MGDKIDSLEGGRIMLQQRFPEAFVNQLKNILINERIETIEDVAFSNSMEKNYYIQRMTCFYTNINAYIMRVSEVSQKILCPDRQRSRDGVQ